MKMMSEMAKLHFRNIQIALKVLRGKLSLQVPDLGSKFGIFLKRILIQHGDPVGCFTCTLPVLI